MITLTLIFCLAAQQRCVERTMLPYPPLSSLMGCMVAGPQAAGGIPRRAPALAPPALSLLGRSAGAARRLTGRGFERPPASSPGRYFTAPAVSPAMNCRDSAM